MAPAAGAGAGAVRRALLVGANYAGTARELRGCVDDARCVKDVLLSRYGYAPEHVRLLADAPGTDPDFAPTGANLRASLAWLVAGARPGDRLVFFYSGHGESLPDAEGAGEGAGGADEADGADEALSLPDGTCVRDDELRERLFARVPPGVKLAAIFDCCHSGTVADLRYSFRPAPAPAAGAPGRLEMAEEPGGLAAAAAVAGDVLCMSACLDAQAAADGAFGGKWVCAPDGRRTFEWARHNGAFTYFLLQALRDGGAGGAGGAGALGLLRAVASRLRAAGFAQTPCLSCARLASASGVLLP